MSVYLKRNRTLYRNLLEKENVAGRELLEKDVRELDLSNKKISNDQELIQSDSTSCPQNQKEITKYRNRQQFKKGTRGKPNEQLFPRQVVIQLPKIY